MCAKRAWNGLFHGPSVARRRVCDVSHIPSEALIYASAFDFDNLKPPQGGRDITASRGRLTGQDAQLGTLEAIEGHSIWVQIPFTVPLFLIRSGAVFIQVYLPSLFNICQVYPHINTRLYIRCGWICRIWLRLSKLYFS